MVTACTGVVYRGGVQGGVYRGGVYRGRTLQGRLYCFSDFSAFLTFLALPGSLGSPWLILAHPGSPFLTVSPFLTGFTFYAFYRFSPLTGKYAAFYGTEKRCGIKKWFPRCLRTSRRTETSEKDVRNTLKQRSGTPKAGRVNKLLKARS